MNSKKQAICDALHKWINQRPGLEFGNYGDVTAYRSEMRRITRQRRDALTLLRAVELRDSISAEDLEAAFSGRLSLKDISARYDDGSIYWAFSLDYCAGQYWPTEYRAAAASVLASCLWGWMRDKCMPEPTLHHNSETGENVKRYNGLRAGDYLRRAFRREFGAAMQRRYFD